MRYDGIAFFEGYTLYTGEWFLLFFEDFSQWNHHEVALVHQWMWYDQVFLVDFHVIVEQNVDVVDANPHGSVFNNDDSRRTLPTRCSRCLTAVVICCSLLPRFEPKPR